MLKTPKTRINQIKRRKPEKFQGTNADWKKLINSILIPPSVDWEWEKNKTTGEWERKRV